MAPYFRCVAGLVGADRGRLSPPLDGSTWGSKPREETRWSSRVRVDDAVRHACYTDLPASAEELRLTENTSGTCLYTKWTGKSHKVTPACAGNMLGELNLTEC